MRTAVDQFSQSVSAALHSDHPEARPLLATFLAGPMQGTTEQRAYFQSIGVEWPEGEVAASLAKAIARIRDGDREYLVNLGTALKAVRDGKPAHASQVRIANEERRAALGLRSNQGKRPIHGV